ncbi:GntR family transcriptional regulator [Microbacterium sp. NPDC056234]|uniref:GntR family transcriptional regulator n=1 Tax=Microbacterium sp. NPDC056234 TaxID=3345757 RepID=UPI0035E11DE3
MKSERARLDQILRLPTSSQHTLGDLVHEELSAAIVDGRLAAGERVNDKGIAEALGISRTPVREALQRLTLAGLVEVSASRYTRVTEVTDEMAASTLEFAVLQAGNALQLAVSRMDDRGLAGAVALLDRMIEASELDETDTLVQATREFVIYIIGQARNADLLRVLRNENAVIERNLRYSARSFDLGTPAVRRGPYRRIRMALSARDADTAEHWFRVQCRLLGAAGMGVAAVAAAA